MIRAGLIDVLLVSSHVALAQSESELPSILAEDELLIGLDETILPSLPEELDVDTPSISTEPSTEIPLRWLNCHQC